jgi:acyl transferase domain-containing protein
VLALSARSAAALEETSQALADWLEAAPRDLRDVAFTLGVGRTPFPHRRAVVGADTTSLVRALRTTRGTKEEGRLADLATAWEAGREVDWGRLYGWGGARLVDVPGHPFCPQRYWPEAASIAPAPARLPVRIEDWRALIDGQARAVLGGTHSGPLDPDAALIDQGFTSLLGMELRRALEGALGRSLPVSLLYDYPTLNRMAASFAAPSQAPRSAPAPTAAPASDFDFLDTLSATELAELIEREVE